MHRPSAPAGPEHPPAPGRSAPPTHALRAAALLALATGAVLAVAWPSAGGTPAPAALPAKSDSPAPATPAEKTLTLRLRSQVETAPGSGRRHTLTTTEAWPAAETAVIVCDMWDKHWCDCSTRRVGEMAPRLDDFVTEARRRGALIIHCPSDTMDFYKDTPQRRLAQSAPVAETKVPLLRWRKLDPTREPALPIDDSDGGCDDANPVKSYRAWSRQIDTIRIHEGDAVTDSAEAYHLMRAKGIRRVLVTGVHTNMCVLGRPFSIRQLVMQGLQVALVRDLTDTMYNPRRAPHVSHFTGTDLVVDHIESWWCPTTTSADVLGGKEFRFKDDTRPTLVIVSAEDEYKTERTLPPFALKELGRSFRLRYVFADAKERHTLPGIEALADADVVLFSVRRRALPAGQMELIRRHVAAGKPVVAIRTASHGFEVAMGKRAAEPLTDWPAFDREVLGCDYTGHHGEKDKTTVVPSAGPVAAKHPILDGVPVEGFASGGSLYKSLPLAEGAEVLAVGRAGNHPEQPVAWTWKRPDGGRTFATSLGHEGDFARAGFARMLSNGIHWAAGITPPKPEPVAAAPFPVEKK